MYRPPLIWLFLIFIFIIVFAGISSNAFAAEDSSEVTRLKAQVEELTRLVASLTKRIEQLEMAKEFEGELAKTAVPPTPVPSPAPIPALSTQRGQGGATYQNMNPDISVVGIAIGKASNDKRDPDRNTVSLQESEITMTKAVSPYARGNLTLGFHGEHAHVEESYADFSYLIPGNWTARVGKFLVPFGLYNTIHTHDWPIVARPLSNEFFLGEEGLSEEGISFNAPIDLHSKTYLRTDVHFLKGDSATLFNNGQTRAIGGSIITKTPLNDRDELDTQFDYLRGAWNTKGDLDSHAIAGSLLLRRRFNQFDRLSLWGEWLWNRREQLDRPSITSSGYTLATMYRFKKDRFWHVGLEYDCTEKPGDSRFNAIARSIFAGYWFTENDRLQFQFRHIRDPFLQKSNDEILLEVIWGMGPHKPHLSNF